MQLNYSMSNTCKTNLAFKFAKDDQTTPKHCHYFSLTYGSEGRRRKKKKKRERERLAVCFFCVCFFKFFFSFWMHWINYSAGSKLHFIGFIHLISQSVFNCHCRNNNVNWFGSTKSHLRDKKKKKKLNVTLKILCRNFWGFIRPPPPPSFWCGRPHVW